MSRYKQTRYFALLLFPLVVAFCVPGATTVSGKVVGENNEAIRNAYVYVVKGEEETLTMANGQFLLKSWQPLPLTLIIEHGGFEKRRILIKRHDQQLMVKLHGRKEN
jgi:hypothetical protein